MNIESQIAVMQAAKDGKQIQVRNSAGFWQDIAKPEWNWEKFEYRIKPEMVIRPYSNIKEFIQAQKEHGPYFYHQNSKDKADESTAYLPSIVSVSAGCFYVCGEEYQLGGDELMKNYIWADGVQMAMVDMPETLAPEEAPEVEFVDLGLPSGKKWAKYAIGATGGKKAEDWYGLYFQFGATKGYKQSEARNHSNWKTCPFNNGSARYDQGYFWAHEDEWFTNDILKPEYDAATVNLGSGWHMPTHEDWVELYKKTKSEWVKDYNGVSGLNGRLFTGKNGETLFIPAAGDVYNGSVYNVGDVGYFWSASLYSGYPNGAWFMGFNSDSVDPYSSFYRCYAFPVFGVIY